MTDLAHQPVAIGLGEETVMFEHCLGVAFGAQQQHADGGLIGAQMQDRVFQFARHGQRPEFGTERMRGFDRGRHGLRRAPHCDGREPARRGQSPRPRANRIRGQPSILRSSGVKLNALGTFRPI